MMEITDAHYLENGNICCRVSLDGINWMPFTASASNQFGIGPEVWAALQEPDVEIAPFVFDETADRARWRKRADLSREAFAAVCARNGWLTEAEARAWAPGLSIPAIAQAALQNLPEEDRFEAELSILSQQRIKRLSRMVLAVQAVMNLTDQEIDAAFGYGLPA